MVVVGTMHPPHSECGGRELDACTARCLHRFTGAGRRLVTKKPRARGENPPGICEARCLSRLRRALRFSRRVPLARGMSDNESSRCFVRSSSLFLFAGFRPSFCLASSLPPVLLTGYSGASGFSPASSFPDYVHPRAVATRLRRCLGFAWLIMNLFFVFIETFGSCDSQLDCFTALRGTDSLPTFLCVVPFCVLAVQVFTLSWFGFVWEEITRLSTKHLRRPAEPQACIPPSPPSATSVRILTTHLEPALKELHFPKGDAPAKLVKILGQGCGDESVACSRHVGGSFSGSEATSAAADLKKPIRQAEQTFMLLEAHNAAEVAAGDHPRPLPPDEARRSCGAISSGPRPCLELPQRAAFPFRKGKVRLRPSPRSWVSWAAVRAPQRDGRWQHAPPSWTAGVSEFELVLGYWLGWCAAQLPPAMQDYLMPEHCPYARLWEEMGHHDIPVPASAC
ncbi:hypothetical protein PAPYR_12656 [Paratrimastix pyriformis]|uniref:Transmembrane protein n=1 Tax=Paratrimastix pyriformis TaxID=342808 RepID=A0ABQ8U338_9EUKA|nr:hypothetical protein PAPYR_12656 [Paratrimastix pyriformis]